VCFTWFPLPLSTFLSVALSSYFPQYRILIARRCSLFILLCSSIYFPAGVLSFCSSNTSTVFLQTSPLCYAAAHTVVHTRHNLHAQGNVIMLVSWTRQFVIHDIQVDSSHMTELYWQRRIGALGRCLVSFKREQCEQASCVCVCVCVRVCVCACVCSSKVGPIILSRCWPTACQFSGEQHLSLFFSILFFSVSHLSTINFLYCPCLLIFCSFLPSSFHVFLPSATGHRPSGRVRLSYLYFYSSLLFPRLVWNSHSRFHLILFSSPAPPPPLHCLTFDLTESSAHAMETTCNASAPEALWVWVVRLFSWPIISQHLEGISSIFDSKINRFEFCGQRSLTKHGLGHNSIIHTLIMKITHKCLTG